MAKLPRVTAKVFASNAAPEDIGQYGSALTGTKVTTGDIAEIQALPAYETGWRGAVISNRDYPTLQEMNGLQKSFSQQITYTFQEGLPEYDPNTTYYKGSWCKSLQENAEGYRDLYESLIDDNLGNPLNDTLAWKLRVLDGANQDLSNLTAAGESHFLKPSQKEEITGWAFPSTKSIPLTPVTNTPYTAPADGYFYCIGTSSTNYGHLLLNNSTAGVVVVNSVYNIDNGIAIFIPISKGNICQLSYVQMKNVSLKFIYAKGEAND